MRDIKKISSISTREEKETNFTNEFPSSGNTKENESQLQPAGSRWVDI